MKCSFGASNCKRGHFVDELRSEKVVTKYTIEKSDKEKILNVNEITFLLFHLSMGRGQ